ncbi:MAG: hypothetical protein IKG22_06570 [Atopobiaceae bacterium]|nr:hypothetical protein [Atopobiaceae bacterium]
MAHHDIQPSRKKESTSNLYGERRAVDEMLLDAGFFGQNAYRTDAYIGSRQYNVTADEIHERSAVCRRRLSSIDSSA